MGENVRTNSKRVIIKQEVVAPLSPTETVLHGESSVSSRPDLSAITTTSHDHDDLSMALVPSSSSHQTPQSWREDWRHEYRGRSIKDKLRFALERDDFYKDVVFIVGKDAIERISAHKLILRLGSPVFESIMEGFNGSSSHRDLGLANNNVADIIEIPEVEPFSFRQLLQYMYTDEFSTENLKCSEIMMILQAARRFQVQDLSMLCIQALKNHINDETAVPLCEMGKDVEDFELRDMALSYICRNPKKIFYSSSFMDLSYKNLALLIEHDDLEWDEISIFKSVLRWADEFCRRRGLEPVANNLRGALGEIIYKIRFPIMSAIEFTFEVIPLKVLTSEEQVQVFKYLCLTETSTRDQLEPTSFNCKKRSYMLNKTGEDSNNDSLLMKIKSDSPHCQPSLASTTDLTDEDNTSQISSCHSSSTLSTTTISTSTKQPKRRRSSSPSSNSSPPTASNSNYKRHTSLFGDFTPKLASSSSSGSKDRSGGKHRRPSIDTENAVEIENVEIEFNQFIQKECTNHPRRKLLESIKLSNVIITDHDKILGKKVRLPKLKEFHLDIKIPLLKHKEVNELATEITLEDYLFFIVKVGKKWSQSEIWSLGINISLIINGITLIKIDHGKKVLIVNKVKDCTKILQSLQDEGGSSSSNIGIRSLVISQDSFPGDSDLYPTSTLERLVLLRMDKIPDFNNFTRKFCRLRELCILSTDAKSMDLCRDLSSTTRDKLRKLALGNTTLLSSTTNNVNNSLKSLEEMFLFRSDWEASFEDNFPSLFPNLKRAGFFLGQKLTKKLLSKLFQIKSVAEIGCGYFDWDSSSSSASMVVDVLKSAGLTENDKSFILTKEGDGNKTWVGRKGRVDLSQEEIFTNFQFYHIYSEYALFRS